MEWKYDLADRAGLEARLRLEPGTRGSSELGSSTAEHTASAFLSPSSPGDSDPLDPRPVFSPRTSANRTSPPMGSHRR